MAVDGDCEAALRKGIAGHFCNGDVFWGGHEVRLCGECVQNVWVLGAGMGLGREDSGK